MFWVQILIACGDNDGGENDDDSAKAAWKFILSNSSSLYFSSMHPNNTGLYIYIWESYTMDYSKGCTDRHITVPHPIGLGSHQHWSIDALIAWVSFIFYFFSTHGGTRAADLQENSIIPIFMACRINVYDFLELVLNFSIVRSFISPYHLE